MSLCTLSRLQDTLSGRMLHLTEKTSALALFAYVLRIAHLSEGGGLLLEVVGQCGLAVEAGSLEH